MRAQSEVQKAISKSLPQASEGLMRSAHSLQTPFIDSTAWHEERPDQSDPLSKKEKAIVTAFDRFRENGFFGEYGVPGDQRRDGEGYHFIPSANDLWLLLTLEKNEDSKALGSIKQFVEGHRAEIIEAFKVKCAAEIYLQRAEDIKTHYQKSYRANIRPEHEVDMRYLNDPSEVWSPEEQGYKQELEEARLVKTAMQAQAEDEKAIAWNDALAKGQAVAMRSLTSDQPPFSEKINHRSQKAAAR